MVIKSKLFGIAVIAVLLFSLSLGFVAAQYTSEKITDVTIGSDGTFSASESDVGVSYLIQGTPGAVGSVTADVYSGNPQATADLPSGVALTSFVVITFNMDASDFSSAQITIAYSDSDVSGLSEPYSIYKYIAESNIYVALPSTVDTVAKTITVTLTSIADPLLAIGGTSSGSGGDSGIPVWTWAAVAAIVIVIIIIAVLVLKKRNPFFYKES